MKLSEMKRVLDEAGVELTKSLGQNFLFEPSQLERIVAAAELTAADSVLEIGPGLGPLTELLLRKSGHVLAIEKDWRLIEILRRRLASGDAPGFRTELELVHADALEFLKPRNHDTAAIDPQFEPQPRDWTGWKLVANLPYSVASPILVELALARHPPERMVVTLQLEVARRLMAGPQDPDYGLLTLLVQQAFVPLKSFKIPASCFFPSPRVDSACVCLLRRPEPLLSDAERPLFVKIVKRSFSQRRKMMLKLLKTDWPESTLDAAYRELGLPSGIRAERVSLEQFIHLTRALA